MNNWFWEKIASEHGANKAYDRWRKSMKKILLGVSIVTIALGAVGCGTAAAEIREEAPRLDDSYENALPVQVQLMLGTLKLEDSELAIDGAQAETLIPLWRAVRSLVTSDTSAEVELSAVLEQIQAAMNVEQIEAIAALQLTEDGLFSTMQELATSVDGLEAFGEGGGFRGGEFGEGSTLPEGFIPGEGGGLGGRPGGEFNPGGGGGGAGGPGVGLSPEERATLQAERGSSGRPGIANRIGLFLMEPFIVILEAKVNTEA
jgi:hypothetical protein